MAEQQAVEQEARALGWVPKEEFRGEEDRWIDADTFVERGKHIMPILQKNNEKLQQQLREESTKREKLEAAVKASQESLAAMEEHFSAATKRQVEKARADLLTELKAAKASGDVDAEVQITDELSQMNIAAAATKVESPKVETKSVAPTEDLPEVKAFKAANSWYGTDLKKTVQFNRIAEDLRLDGNTLTGQAFLDATMNKYNEANRPTESKVESGGGRQSGGSTTKGSRFADLPPEAKQACRDDAKRLVGENRRFKTNAEWEQRYAEIYFGDEQ